MNEKPTPGAATAFVEGDVVLDLDEFCMRLSMSDGRVELIGAFHFTEKIAGRSRDNEAAYKARFDAFINKPV